MANIRSHFRQGRITRQGHCSASEEGQRNQGPVITTLSLLQVSIVKHGIFPAELDWSGSVAWKVGSTSIVRVASSGRRSREARPWHWTDSRGRCGSVDDGSRKAVVVVPVRGSSSIGSFDISIVDKVEFSLVCLVIIKGGLEKAQRRSPGSARNVFDIHVD